MNKGLLDTFPIFGVYIGIAIVLLISIEIGYQIGKHVRGRKDKEANVTLGPVVGGVLSMLAFVLAFTFATTASQNNRRKQGVLDEANAIGRAYLRADLMNDQSRREVKRILRNYVDSRLQAVNIKNLDAVIAKSLEQHALLWAEVSSAARTDPDANTALIIESINNVIEMHEIRLNAGLYNRIPGTIWITLFVISALTMMTIGAQAGLAGSRRLVAILPLALAFAALATVVVDLDHPQRGLLKVHQQAMIDLQNVMNREIQ